MVITSFNVGDKTVYPRHGVAEVTGIERREISGATLEFYVLRVLENDMTVMVPKHNAGTVGLRRLIGQEEVDDVYDVLRHRGAKISTATWNRRYREYSEKINTGSLVEIATVLRDLSILRNNKNGDLSFGEKQMLDRAKNLLAQELAIAKGQAEDTVKNELNAMFKELDGIESVESRT
jgi:CarD family transcriptional regulator